MDFINISSIEELLKKATVTVLLEKISFIKNRGTSIIPVQCPAVTDGKEGKEGLIYNADNRAVCMKGTEECPYFEAATFDINGYIKEITCEAR